MLHPKKPQTLECTNVSPLGIISNEIEKPQIDLSNNTPSTAIASVNFEQSKWYAIYTRSRFEKKIHTALEKSGFEAFLPLIKENRVWSDRIKTVQVPLLPSYVFVKLSTPQRSQVYYFPGFVRFISFEGKPCEVKERDIVFLKKIVTCGFSVQSCAKIEVGELVRITKGPFKGWEGKVIRNGSKSRIVFQFDCIQTGISVEVEVADVEKLI